MYRVAEDTIILDVPGAAAAVCWAAHRNRSEMRWTELGETWRQCILPLPGVSCDGMGGRTSAEGPHRDGNLPSGTLPENESEGQKSAAPHRGRPT